MTEPETQTNSTPAPKPAAKPKPKKRSKPKRRKKAANFTFKGPGGAKERKARGEHLLIVRSRISTVKRIDAKLAKLAKKTGKFHSRNDWLASVIDVASKR